MRGFLPAWRAGIVGGGLVLLAALATAQPPAVTPTSGPARAAAEERKPAIIERAPLELRPAEQFRIPLHLDAVAEVDVSARTDGVVGGVLAKLGATVQAQAEVVRLDSEIAQLELQRAQAAVRAAQAEIKAADGAAREAAEARADVSKLDLDIAQARLNHCNLKAPLQGTVIRLSASPGEYVRAGAPLLTIADPRKLQVVLPVDTKTVTVGGAIDFLIEDVAASGQVEALVPLPDRFEPLRDLFLSVGAAVAVLDNSSGKFRPGQTVYSMMIPRAPVTEVPVTALLNADGGGRKVQVLRDNFVRDVPVELLGQVGSEYVFVSGRFGPSDELILRSSETLLDGTRVAPQTATTPGGEPGTRQGAPASGSPTRSGF